ncbi:MAG: amidophosphoribosyltransferase [Planctomycetota bacterium]
MTLPRPTPLTVHATDPDAPKEKCGVVGVWAHPDAVERAYLGLYAQQHRGQEAAGIAVSNGQAIRGHLGMGLVSEVFTRPVLHELREARKSADSGDDHARGGGAIGHNRYSTAGGSRPQNAQPIIESLIAGGASGWNETQVAVAHNGNLINAAALRHEFAERGHLFHTTSDTEVMVHLIASPEQRDQADPLAATLRRLQGAFSVLFMFPDRIEAARDPWGWRPLVLGRLEDGSDCVASETVALEVMGATLVREVEPGEIVTLDHRGVTSRRYAEPSKQLAQCVFEHVYFASPASQVFGQSVQIARERMGAALAKESSVEADYVMPMPDSGRSAANGYARASGIPYREGIVPNRYVGRTFIKPTQDQRRAAVRLKLNVISEIVKGKKLIVVDDSIVRGTTTREKMRQIRDAGAEEIHVRISCPPIRNPCYFGVDFATREQLIAYNREVEQIRDFLGVDSLAFLSLDGLLSCMDRSGDDYCTACFSGNYRIDVEHAQTGVVVGDGQVGMF